MPSSVRARVTISSVTPTAGGYQLASLVTAESDSGGKPVCVAELLARYNATAG